MTDPQWYIDAQRGHAQWAADVDACVQWLTSADAQDERTDAGYIMMTAMAAYALHLHRCGGKGVVTYRYELLDGALVAVGRPGTEAPATMEVARARLFVAAGEMERLRAKLARAGSTVAAAVHATRGLEHVTVAPDRDLLRRALLALRPRHGQGRLPRRAVVAAVLRHGSGVSSAICRALDIDPDEVAGACSTERVHPCSDAQDPGDEHTEVPLG